MKLLFTIAAIVIALSCSGQMTVDGNAGATSVANNGPAITVDNSLTVTSATTIDQFRVSVSTNFSTGDVLGYTGALPSGVTAGYNGTTGILTFSGIATAAAYQTLLRTVTFLTTSSSTLSRTIKFEAGDGTLKFYNGHYYKMIPGTYTWTAAKANAATNTFYGLQGYLATATSALEDNFIYNQAGKGWIGASDATTEGASENNWFWVTGPEAGTKFSTGSTAVSGQYANWYTGEPNNSGGTENYAENAFTNNGQWNDANGTTTNNYILEYGGLPSGVTVDNFHTRPITMIATQLQTTAAPVPYALHATSVNVDNSLLVSSAGNITDAKVTISGNFISGDVLSYTGTLTGGITSGSYNTSTGVLSFAGTAAASTWQTLLRTVKFNSTSNTTGNRVITFSAGNQVAFTNGHFYEYISTTASWTAAKTAAAARNYLGLQGYLATIISPEENDFIRQKINADAWIGASDDVTYINAATGATTYADQTAAEGKWYWVTGPAGEIGIQFSQSNGTPVAVGGRYMNWNSGEPNNSSTENYCEFYGSGANLGKWNDLGTSQSLGYITEYGGLATDPLVFLSANRTMQISTILPLTGITFDVIKVSNGAKLNWSTRTEVNTDRFDILYGTDGINYTKIGSVKAAGNSDKLQQYEWLHTPMADVNYYRLQMFDLDGRSTYSLIRQLYNGKMAISLSPNPVQSILTIKYPHTGSNTTLNMYNLDGKKVYSSAISQIQTQVNTEHLPAGTYIVEVVDKTAAVRLKFVKD